MGVKVDCCRGSHSLLHIVTSGGGREVKAKGFIGEVAAALSENGGFFIKGAAALFCDLGTVKTIIHTRTAALHQHTLVQQYLTLY